MVGRAGMRSAGMAVSTLRKIDFLQCQERSAIGVCNELPRLVGDPPDVRGEDQVQSLADLF